MFLYIILLLVVSGTAQSMDTPLPSSLCMQSPEKIDYKGLFDWSVMPVDYETFKVPHIVEHTQERLVTNSLVQQASKNTFFWSGYVHHIKKTFFPGIPHEKIASALIDQGLTALKPTYDMHVKLEEEIQQQIRSCETSFNGSIVLPDGFDHRWVFDKETITTSSKLHPLGHKRVDGTLLELVAQTPNVELFDALMATNKFNVAQEPFGWRSLLLSASGKSFKHILLKYKKNINLDEQDRDGTTLLMWLVEVYWHNWASYSGTRDQEDLKEIIKTLLDAGANLAIADNKGKTVYDTVEKFNWPRLQEIRHNAQDVIDMLHSAVKKV